MVPQLSAYVGTIPNTQEAQGFAIAYELTNTRKLVFQNLHALVCPRYRKGHCIVSILRGAGECFTLRNLLSCYSFSGTYAAEFDVRALFPQMSTESAERLRCDLGLKNDSFSKWYQIAYDDVFYGPTLMQAKLEHAEPINLPRERPLPQTLPYQDMLELHTTLTRYVRCLDDIDAFVGNERFVDPYGKRKDILKETRRLRKRLLRGLQETTKVPLIATFQRLGIPAGHTTATLCAEFTAEQLQDMIQGHPANVITSTTSSPYTLYM